MTLPKEKVPVTAMWEEDGSIVEIEGGETVVLNTDWMVGEPIMMLAGIGGKEVTVEGDLYSIHPLFTVRLLPVLAGNDSNSRPVSDKFLTCKWL